MYSVYYDGVESTAQYSLLNTHEYFEIGYYFTLTQVVFWTSTFTLLTLHFLEGNGTLTWVCFFSTLCTTEDNPQHYSALPLNYQSWRRGGGLSVRDHRVYINKQFWTESHHLFYSETLSSGFNISLLTHFHSLSSILHAQITSSFTPLETTRSINMFPAKPGLLISVSTPSNESVSADLETTGQREMCVCFKSKVFNLVKIILSQLNMQRILYVI